MYYCSFCGKQFFRANKKLVDFTTNLCDACIEFPEDVFNEVMTQKKLAFRYAILVMYMRYILCEETEEAIKLSMEKWVRAVAPDMLGCIDDICQEYQKESINELFSALVAKCP